MVRTPLLGIWNNSCSPGDRGALRTHGRRKTKIFDGKIVPTFSEVAVVGGRLGFAPLEFEVVPVPVVDPLPAATLTVAAHSEGQGGRK